MIYKLDGSMNVQKNFKLWEFKSRVTDEIVLDFMLPYRLQILRDLVKRSISIQVAYRTPDQNIDAGGSPKSHHMYGRAADIHVDGMTPEEVYPFAAQAGFNGIGVYDTWLHVDVGSTIRRWGDYEGLEEPESLNTDIVQLNIDNDILRTTLNNIYEQAKGVLNETE